MSTQPIKVPQEGEHWEHYKTHVEYKILGIGSDEDGYPVVVYYDPHKHPNRLFTRKLHSFLQTVDLPGRE